MNSVWYKRLFRKTARITISNFIMSNFIIREYTFNYVLSSVKVHLKHTNDFQKMIKSVAVLLHFRVKDPLQKLILSFLVIDNWLFENWLTNLKCQWTLAMQFSLGFVHEKSLGQVCAKVVDWRPKNHHAQICCGLLQHAETNQTFLGNITSQAMNRGFSDMIHKLNRSRPNESIYRRPGPKFGKFGLIKRQCWLLFWLWRNCSSWICYNWPNHQPTFLLGHCNKISHLPWTFWTHPVYGYVNQ